MTRALGKIQNKGVCGQNLGKILREFSKGKNNWGLLYHEGGKLCNRICSLAHTTLLEVRGQVIISRQKNGPNFVNIIKKNHMGKQDYHTMYENPYILSLTLCNSHGK